VLDFLDIFLGYVEFGFGVLNVRTFSLKNPMFDGIIHAETREIVHADYCSKQVARSVCVTNKDVASFKPILPFCVYIVKILLG